MAATASPTMPIFQRTFMVLSCISSVNSDITISHYIAQKVIFKVRLHLCHFSAQKAQKVTGDVHSSKKFLAFNSISFSLFLNLHLFLSPSLSVVATIKKDLSGVFDWLLRDWNVSA